MQMPPKRSNLVYSVFDLIHARFII